MHPLGVQVDKERGVSTQVYKGFVQMYVASRCTILNGIVFADVHLNRLCDVWYVGTWCLDTIK